jgi:hypothetical protein
MDGAVSNDFVAADFFALNRHLPVVLGEEERREKGACRRDGAR